MKKLLLILLSNLFIIQGYSQDSLNLDFEQYDNTRATKLKGWLTSAPNFAIIDSINVFQGKYSLMLLSPGNSKSSVFSTRVNNENKPPYLINISAQIKTEIGENGFTGFLINVLDGKNTVIQDFMRSVRETGFKDWHNISTKMLITQPSTDIYFGGAFFGTGKAWFDNMTFRIITNPEISDTARRYLNDFFNIIETKSIMKDSVDFVNLKERTFLYASGAETTTDCYPALRYILDALHDNHSYILDPHKTLEKESSTFNSDNKNPLTTCQIINSERNFGYISVPYWVSINPIESRLFADTLQNQIKRLDKKNIYGWIIDLRQNSGGNCWPMIAGLGPLIGEGIFGYFISTNPTSNQECYYNKGKVGHGKYEEISIPKPYRLKYKDKRIAVLIGPKTASSGELVTISFIGKQGTRLFGEPTAGLTSANSLTKLSDGATLWLTTSIDADRNLKKYGGKIIPDENVPFNVTEYAIDDDPVVKAAINWLNKKN